MDSDVVIRKQVNSYHTLDSMSQRLEHWHYLLHILAKVIDSNLHSFDQKTFDKLYLDLENFFFSDSLEVLQISVLNNLKMTADISREIGLSDNISIRRTTTDELEIVQEFFHPYPRNHDIFILERKYTIPKYLDQNTNQDDSDDVLRLFTSIIYALRLYHGGDVGIKHIYTKLSLDVPMPYILLDVTSLELNTDSSISYHLEKIDVDKFCEFWNSYESILYKVCDPIRYKEDRLNVLKTSIERFNLSYAEKTRENRFVDIIISLESLFTLRNDPMDSLTYRLALRVSKFLESNSEIRKKLYDEFKDLYSQRSGVVHKGKKSVEFGLIEDIAKESLILMLDEAKVKDAEYNHSNAITSIDFK